MTQQDSLAGVVCGILSQFAMTIATNETLRMPKLLKCTQRDVHHTFLTSLAFLCCFCCLVMVLEIEENVRSVLLGGTFFKTLSFVGLTDFIELVKPPPVLLVVVVLLMEAVGRTLVVVVVVVGFAGGAGFGGGGLGGAVVELGVVLLGVGVGDAGFGGAGFGGAVVELGGVVELFVSLFEVGGVVFGGGGLGGAIVGFGAYGAFIEEFNEFGPSVDTGRCWGCVDCAVVGVGCVLVDDFEVCEFAGVTVFAG